MEQSMFLNRQDAIIFYSGHAIQGLLSSGMPHDSDRLPKVALKVAETMADAIGLTVEADQESQELVNE